jgi:hypothetical protein
MGLKNTQLIATVLDRITRHARDPIPGAAVAFAHCLFPNHGLGPLFEMETKLIRAPALWLLRLWSHRRRKSLEREGPCSCSGR